MKVSQIIDTVAGTGRAGTLKGMLEGSVFAAAIPILDLDLSTPAGRLAALVVAWRVLYGLARK